jgi:hypothetical protein
VFKGRVLFTKEFDKENNVMWQPDKHYVVSGNGYFFYFLARRPSSYARKRFKDGHVRSILFIDVQSFTDSSPTTGITNCISVMENSRKCLILKSVIFWTTLFFNCLIVDSSPTRVCVLSLFLKHFADLLNLYGSLSF